jgi:hypothetical protein
MVAGYIVGEKRLRLIAYLLGYARLCTMTSGDQAMKHEASRLKRDSVVLLGACWQFASLIGQERYQGDAKVQLQEKQQHHHDQQGGRVIDEQAR